MRLSRLLILAACLTWGSARADALDDAIQAEMTARQVPGLNLVVVKDGKVVREKSYGMANLEWKVPVTPSTVFQSGSVGKTFTAALVLLLAQDGKLSLDDPLSRHLDGTPLAWRAITIRQLMNHTSGLGDPYRYVNLRRDYNDAELIALYATIPVVASPGAKYSYSNMGYHLLGFISNRAGGEFYGEQLRKRIFAPLGMSARIISDADIVPHRAAGYELRDGSLANQAWVSPSLNRTADGSLYLTARDLVKWDQALHGDQILSAEMRTASWTPATLNDGSTSPYGLGWHLAPRNGHRNIYHGGAWQGFRSMINRYVDDRLTVIVLANSATANAARFADMAAAHYVPALAVKAPPAPR